MKIIKPGTKKEEIWQGECHSCGAVIQANRSELDVQYDRDGDMAPVKCLQCGAGMWLYLKINSGDNNDFSKTLKVTFPELHRTSLGSG